VTPADRHRLLVGVCLAVHDLDQTAFRALLSGVPRQELLVVIRQLTEVVVAAQLAAEEGVGAARDRLARQALTLAIW